MNQTCTDEAEYNRRMVSRRRVTGTIRSLVNVKGLQLEHGRVLHELLLISVLLYSSEKMIWKEKERSRIWAVQMEDFRGLVSIRRMIKSFKSTDKEVVRSEKWCG